MREVAQEQTIICPDATKILKHSSDKLLHLSQPCSSVTKSDVPASLYLLNRLMMH